MNEIYTPINLSREQSDQLYADAYAQAEAQEAVAWMNYVRAKAAREALKVDWERVQACPPSANGASKRD
jgi:hypothetical protein